MKITAGIVGVCVGSVFAQPVDVTGQHPVRPTATYEPLGANLVLTDGNDDYDDDLGFGGSVAIADGVIYVSSPGEVYAFDEDTGALLWVHNRGPFRGHGGSSELQSMWGVACSPRRLRFMPVVLPESSSSM